jgi:hypothetical protein
VRNRQLHENAPVGMIIGVDLPPVYGDTNQIFVPMVMRRP